MDPASILSIFGLACSAAKGAFVVGTAIYKFKNDVKDFDNKAAAFVDEIKALGTACEVVSQRLKTIVQNGEKISPSGSQSEQLWKCLENQLHTCQKTVEGLQDALGDAILSKGDLNIWDKVLKQFMLYLQVFDVSEARERIRSHTTSLQIILLSIGIEVTYLMPQRIDQQLQKQLATLTEMKLELSELLEKRVKGDLNGDSKNETAILIASSRIISSGETLYEASIAGSSTFGGIDPLKKPSIHEWLAHAEHIDHDNMTNTSADAHSIFSLSKPVDSVTDETEPHVLPHDKSDKAGRTLKTPTENMDDDSDISDDDVDFAEHCIKCGRDAFEKKDYSKANAELQEALKVVLELPMSLRRVCDTEEVKYMLAHCAFHLEDAASAQSALLAVLGSASAATTHQTTQKRVYDTSHMLSQACVRLGQLEQARISCKSALKGRQRLFGKNHEVVYESTALMARIMELQGNITRANLMARIIPESHEHLVTQFKDLNVEQTNHLRIPEEHSRPPSERSQPLEEDRIEHADGAIADTASLVEQTTISEIGTVNLDASLKSLHVGTTTEIEVIPTRNAPIQRSYTFQVPDLQKWADLKGLVEIGPLSLDERKKLLVEHELIPESTIEKALATADDEQAFRLCSTRSRFKSFVSHVRFSLVRELRLAVLFGVVSVVKALVDKGVSLDAADSGGWTLLHYAAYSGSISTAEVLINAGASVEVSERKGHMGPLSIALSHDRLDICDLLYQQGAHPLREHHWKIGTPLHLACAKNILPLVRAWSIGRIERITSAMHSVAPILLDRDLRKFVADFGNNSTILPRVVKRMTITPIGVAALMGSVDVMRWAISKGAKDFEPCKLCDTEYGEGHPVSALALAAAAGHVTMVKLLLYMDDDSADDDSNNEALKMAVINRMEDAACALLDAGVRADKQVIYWAEKYHLARFLNVVTFDQKSRSTVNWRQSRAILEQAI